MRRAEACQSVLNFFVFSPVYEWRYGKGGGGCEGESAFEIESGHFKRYVYLLESFAL